MNYNCIKIDSKMIANNLTSAYPTHPGEKDEIKYRRI